MAPDPDDPLCRDVFTSDGLHVGRFSSMDPRLMVTDEACEYCGEALSDHSAAERVSCERDLESGVEQRSSVTTDRLTAARRQRKAMLANLRRVVKLCDCAWPIQTYRNGHGHAPSCPAADAAREGSHIDGSADGAPT